MRDKEKLKWIKLLHTLVWGVFVACILLIPVLAYFMFFGWVTVLFVIVIGEVLVLYVNDWRCPLTKVASRYTDQRQANFDIYLPEWLAQYNKEIFGTLFVVGVLFTISRFLKFL